MKPSNFYRFLVVPALSALLLAWQLVGCGGTQMAGGVGSGGSGLAEGLVTGFGSVIVDGVAYSDSAATVERWGEAGVAEAKLGQRVRVVLENGQATRIVVLPQLIGEAVSAPDAQGDFVILGQRVRIVDSSTADLPITVLEGLTQVKVGDALEVHGQWSRDNAGRNVLIASRIEKRSVLPDLLLLTAVLQSRSGNTLVLDDAAHTVVSAPGLAETVQSDALISLWLTPQAVLSPGNVALPWIASRVEMASAQAESAATLELRGAVSASQPGRIWVQGVWVTLPGDVSNTLPSDGTPVQLKLIRNGAAWQASNLTLLRASNQPEVELKGSLRWNSGASTIQLRGTTVQLAPNLLTGNCANLLQDEEVFISLKAQQRSQGQVPQTSQIECSRQIPETSVQEAQGKLVSVDAVHKTLDVRVGNSTLSLDWNTNQTLMPPWAQLTAGLSVEIEYQRSSTGLTLRKIKIQ